MKMSDFCISTKYLCMYKQAAITKFNATKEYDTVTSNVSKEFATVTANSTKESAVITAAAMEKHLWPLRFQAVGSTAGAAALLYVGYRFRVDANRLEYAAQLSTEMCQLIAGEKAYVFFTIHGTGVWIN
eukprot:NODE_613_length_5985_cov_0.176351.p4 type:complete len:129 gc:universal NODE_613_length_5985_cov_0.176351:5368-5754(+)